MAGSLQHMTKERRHEIAMMGKAASDREKKFTRYCLAWIRSRGWLVDRLRQEWKRAEAEAV